LVDVAGGLISLVVTAIFLRFWKPTAEWEFSNRHHGLDDVPPDAAVQPPPTAIPPESQPVPSRGDVVRAWVPWALLSTCVFLWGVPDFRALLDAPTQVEVEVPHLHNVVHRAPVAVEPAKSTATPTGEPALFRFNWLSATGTGILVAAILSAFWMKIPVSQFLIVYADTVWRMAWPLFTIAAMMAVAFVTRYSGSDVTLGLAFTQTGVLYPFFAAMLGWLGVALTGSDTASNALFGSLQKVTAELLHLNPILICAANSTGGVMGKMIDAQSIVVAAVATGQRNQEGRILRFVFWHSVVLAMLVGLLTLLQAYVFPWMVPEPTS
jgi:lactate permease